jgi:hypothetical protein
LQLNTKQEGQAMNILNSFKRFIVRAGKNPLWVFAWTIFVACLIFIKGYYLDSPERTGRVNSDLARYRTYIQDYDQATRVKQIVDHSYDSYNSIIYEVNAIGGLHVQHRTIPKSQLIAATSRAKTVRQELAEAAGTLSGLTFINDTLNPYIQTFASNLKHRQENIDVILEFYDALSIGDQTRIDAGFSAIYEVVDLDYRPAEAEMQETIKSFNRDILNYKYSMNADIDKELQVAQIFQIMEIAAKAAVAYAIVFPLVAIIMWYRRSRIRRTSQRRQPRAQGRRGR